MKLQLFQPKETKPDIFDRVGKDIFDRTELDPADKVLLDPELDKKIDRIVEQKVAAALAAIPAPLPSKETIREIRVEVPKKDTRDLVEKSQLDAALKKIKELEEKLEETDQRARTPMVIPGGPGVIGIPPPEAAPVNYVLTRNAQGKAEWKEAQGGNGSGLSGYTVSNNTALRTIDPTTVTYDELARFVATMAEDLS